MPLNTEFRFLQTFHPVYDAWRDVWRRDERRMRGGEAVLDELRRFDWETEGGNHYTLRQGMAVYVNFPEMFATSMVGQLMRKAPRVDEGALNFGTLGEVRSKDRDPSNPTRAEMIFYNADGVGNDGSQWDNFWANSTRWTMPGGFRWILVEGPEVDSDVTLTRQDEIEGKRPYLCSLSPLSVTNWQFKDGKLQWGIVVNMVRKPTIVDGQFKNNNDVPEYVLLVKKGITLFGPKFAGGGWWKFDEDLNPIDKMEGDWAKTRGDIPMFIHYYERDTGEVATGLAPTDANTPMTGRLVKWPAVARPATIEIGNAAVAYMNLSSAADFDAWDAAMSVTYLIGADEEGYNLAAEKLKEGSRIIPVPINRDAETTPQIHDGSTGAVVAEVFEARLKTKREEVSRMAVMEATSSPEGSGVQAQAEFAGAKAPRLALMASELEQAQNTAIWFLELRWGNAKPTGSVSWTRDFSLIDVLDSINSFFALQKLAGVMSKTLTAKGLVMAARSRDLIKDDAEAKKITGEYEQSAVDLESQLTPDGAQETGKGNGIGGDGTSSVPGQKRLNSVGAKSAK